MPCPLLSCLNPGDLSPLLEKLKHRENPDQAVEDRVRSILAQVQTRGDEALAEYTRRFDCPDFTPDMLAVPEGEITRARDLVPARDMDILAEAAHNIRVFHESQKQRSWWQTGPNGAILGQLVRPVEAVGLYVPGGQGGETPLVSSLLMNAIPAQVAGVQRLVAVSPPRKDGGLNPYILAAADLLGLKEIHRVGSAWAVAALAYGTQTIPRVDVLAGPGNIYVTTAKRLLAGKVGLDMIAGPSEIVILTDGQANPAWLAADMLSQAEHDPLASAILITAKPQTSQAVLTELERQLALLPRNEIARKALGDWGAIIEVPNLDTGMDLVNLLAPEHLELAVAEPFSIVGQVRHAGAIFMGANCPEPVGDYFAGPNHVLPTLGTARFSSALSVETFLKKSSLIATGPEFARQHGDKIARLARLEGLEAHARSMEWRINTKGD